MPLVVETGEGIDQADSCVSLVDAQAFIDARALSVTLTEGLLLRSMDALVSATYKGTKTHDTNALPMPRTDLENCDGVIYLPNVVPPEFIRAQIWGAFYIAQGNDPAAAAEAPIKKEKVDVIEVEYAIDNGKSESLDFLSLPNVRDSLRCLLADSSLNGAVGGGMIDRA